MRGRARGWTICLGRQGERGSAIGGEGKEMISLCARMILVRFGYGFEMEIAGEGEYTNNKRLSLGASITG